MSVPSKEAIEAVGELMRETNIFPNQVEIAKQIVQSAIDKATEPGRKELLKLVIDIRKSITAFCPAVSLLLRAEVSHPLPGRLRVIKALARIVSDYTRDIPTPIKKGAKNHGVRVRRGR
jgi:hypothetical protein